MSESSKAIPLTTRSWRASFATYGRDRCWRSADVTLGRFQPVDAEQPIGIAPDRAWHEAGFRRKRAETRDRIFLRPLGMDRFALRKRNRLAAQIHALAAGADEIHPDA